MSVGKCKLDDGMMHAQEQCLFRIISRNMINHGDTSVDKISSLSAKILAHLRSGAIAANHASPAGYGPVLEFNLNLTVLSDINPVETLVTLRAHSVRKFPGRDARVGRTCMFRFWF